ncbi:Fe-S cluster assembly protein HesB [Vibrio coralliilyticus]|mgnify:CR=1 FL=1|jgi:DNA-binding MurR/RpiR family transcriptional regulator|uniref:Fe-S cluster assembly protein HesB n=1 Tax=Vibrio coralliilyticus TaxID=190893 RepID=A0A7Y4BRG4_9VIBR|nr:MULTISPECIES: MurR/RpiR family transcriptional regulator [Vibrio]AIU66498.1 Fe-S cluster assembly protein HesB [Vibrio coralliilyticus]ANW25465.1 Fe-S cluster assembly protein HesB [Vibrio coralliilyticus]AXN30837.1 MurR/RpiR family transcriptional regulator [Vibrio coralliilyticus]EEX31446.1 predicted transcriptional regulator of the myo-inositol catabolism operon [Vibrio coralliilyticus ATCC BAA-450]ERB65855.1 iron-sulfur cluster assembly protein HesB [Vibrio coralliilyticus OCN008]
MKAASSLGELQDQIRNNYSDLSKRLQQVAKYVLDNSNSVAFDTVAVIAQQAEVPPSTLIRFASAFGFSGFNDMKQLFRRNLVEETTSYTDRARLYKQLEGEPHPPETPKDILEEFARANSQAMNHLAAQTSAEKLEQAVDILRNAENIYLIGLRRSFSVASYLTYALRHLDKRAFLIDGLGGMFKEQLSMIGPKDAIVSISFSPYAQETVMLSEVASKAGAHQIVITDSQISPLAAFSDVCFVVKEAKVDAFRSQSASLCLAQTLAVSMAFDQAEKL